MRGLLKAALSVAPVLALTRGVEALPPLNQAYITLQPPGDDGETAGQGIAFRFDVFESNDACDFANVTINGDSLPEGGRGTLAFDHGTTIVANWKFTCMMLNGEAQEQTMDLNLDYINGRAVSDIALAIRFQQVAPARISDVVGPATWVRHNRAEFNMPSEDPFSQDEMGDDLDLQLAELEFLRSQMAGLREMINMKEQYLHETFGLSAPRGGGIRQCDNIKCVIGTIYETVSEAATALYGDMTGVRGKRPCKGPHKKFPHHGWPHHGNHSHHGNHTHGNHTYPHPPWRCPPHRIPFHPPPFCRCKPPPGHGPHHPPPPDMEFGEIPPPPDGEPDGLPPPPPPPDRHHGKTHGIRPPPPPPPHRHDHGPPHGPPNRHLGNLLNIAIGATLLFILVRILHKRCHAGRRSSCSARRQARHEARRKRCQAKVRGFLHAFFLRHSERPNSHYGEEEEEKAAMLPRGYEDNRSHTTMEEELASCRIAADMVGDMVAAEEGRAQRASQATTTTTPARLSTASARYTPPSSAPAVDDDEALPAYDDVSSEQGSSVVADGLRYTPGSSECTSSVAGDQAGTRGFLEDTKH